MFVPMVRLHSKQRPKWITANLQHQLNCLHSLWKRMIRRQDPTASTRLEQAKQLLHEELMIAKSAYESKLVQELAFSNSSKIYKYLHSLSSNSSIPSNIRLGSQPTSTISNKASLFNHYISILFLLKSLSPTTAQ